MVDVLFSFLCVLISIRCLGCSFKEIFRTLKDFLLYILFDIFFPTLAEGKKIVGNK